MGTTKRTTGGQKFYNVFLYKKLTLLKCFTREILLVENLQFSGGLEPALPPPGADDSDDRHHNGSGDGDGLDLDHVLPVVEWLARFHGLSLVLLSRSEGGARRWLEENPWVRRMGLSEEREEEENGNTADKGKTGLEKLLQAV